MSCVVVGWLVVVGCGCVVVLMILLPFFSLQILCVSWRLVRSYGEPPRLMGSFSSISGLSGCGFPSGPLVRVLSTGAPQSAQCVSLARICVRAFRRLWPFL